MKTKATTSTLFVDGLDLGVVLAALPIRRHGGKVGPSTGGSMFKSFPMILALCALVLSPALQAQEAPPAKERRIGSDSFVFGGSVRIDQPVAGDLIAAGGNVDVDAPVAGDAMLAGGNLRVTAKVEGSVQAGGGRLILDAPVGRNVRVGGGQVDVGPMAAIGGNVTVGGGQVTLRGPVKGNVTVGGGRVTIDAAVEGDVESYAGRLTLGPNARLAGKLRYRSGDELVRDPAATVAGAIERLPMPGRSASSPTPSAQRAGDWGEPTERAGPSWFWTAGLMAIAAILVAALPVTSMRVAEGLRTRFGWSLLWGFIALVCLPVAALILLVTIIGIPVALLLVLLYLALLLVGYVGSAIGLGQWALARFKADAAQRNGWRIGAAMLAVVLLALLGSVPFIGGFVAFVAMLAGIGAIALLFAPRKAAA
jgi:cytoskeletal protein CcmA (bactofilin family)